MALRQLGLAITDQFTGGASDRFNEAHDCFEKLTNPYERSYYLGIVNERRAKAQLSAGHHSHTLRAGFEEALRHYEEAEKVRPQGNDDALLRWNRCLRLMQGIPEGQEAEAFDVTDAPPYFRD